MTEEASDRTLEHRETVRAFSRAGGPLDPDGPNATIANPLWFRGRRVYRPLRERRALHRRLLDEVRAEHPAARAERRAIVLAGPPGAGKSTVLRDVLGVDASAWVTIDADEFKKKLLREALADGSTRTCRRGSTSRAMTGKRGSRRNCAPTSPATCSR